jgi:16S rRNA (cytidine1402-2'-O)-methyltransferase
MRVLGTLVMAAGSLGAEADLPARSLTALRTGDLLVFEEDRIARSLLKAAGVHRDYLRYTEHKEQNTLDEVEAALKAGKTVVYMSDQGTPGLADPGRELTAVAYRLGARVTTIPGPSSVTAALAACPFDCNRFLCAGFPPRDGAERRAYLERVAGRASEPVVLLDTPYRLEALLDACIAALGASRKALLALDISGPAEAFLYGDLTSLKKRGVAGEKLNFVLVLEPPIRTNSGRRERGSRSRL